MRPIAVAVLLAIAGPAASAQGRVGGLLREARTARPLACWRVELRESRDSVSAVAYTRRDGAFEFPAPAAGSYVFRFEAYGLQPLSAHFESAGTSMDSERIYHADLVLTDSTGATSPWSSKSAPRPVPGRGLPYYSDELRSRGIEGRVNFAIAIDSLGRVDVAGSFTWGATHPEFDAAMKRALRDMRFTMGGQPGAPACAFVGSFVSFRLAPR